MKPFPESLFKNLKIKLDVASKQKREQNKTESKTRVPAVRSVVCEKPSTRKKNRRITGAMVSSYKHCENPN